MRFASNKDNKVWNCITIAPLFIKLTCTLYLNHSIHLNVPQHWFSIGFNTFVLVTTVSSHDVTATNVLMNPFVLTCKWSIMKREHKHTMQARRKQIESGEAMSGQLASTRSLFKAIQLPCKGVHVCRTKWNIFNTIHKFYQILEHLQKFAPSCSIIIHIILFNKSAL